MATISQIEIKGVLYDIKDTTARQDTGTELDTAMSDTSENGVQNKVVKAYVDDAITTESITNTLGYKPADQEDVSKLSKEKVSMPKDSEGAPQTGVAGQVLESAGDGTTRWMDKTPVDKTLTKEGEAADAKATGEAISQLSDTINNLPSGSGGLNSTAKNLLVTILRNGVYSVDQSANITALETALSSGGDTEQPESGIVQTGSILAITSGVTATQTGSVLAIAYETSYEK